MLKPCRFNLFWIFLLLLITSCLPRPAAHAVGSKELEEDHRLSLEFKTPHTKWATPYANGKTRVLFFCDGHGTNPRHIIELMQRFDLEAEAVYWATIVDSPIQVWHGEEAGIARMKRLLAQPWDCFVFLGIPPSRLPAEQFYAMLLAVTRRTGLVLVGTEDARLLKPERQYSDLPSFLAMGTPLTGLTFVRSSVLKEVSEETATDALAASRMVATYKVKEGRGVHLPPIPNLEYRPGWDTDYEYWTQLLGRTILWAANNQPEIGLTVRVRQPSFNRAALPQEAITIRYCQESRAKPLTIDVHLRRHDGWQIALPREKDSATIDTFTRTIPLLPAGRYFVDVRVHSEAGIEAWASATFEVISPRGVNKIILDKSWEEIGGTFSGAVQLRGQSLSSKETVRVDVCDRRNRVIARQEVPANGDEAQFKFAVESWMPMLVRVEATLLADGHPVASAYEFFNVTKRHRGQFNFVMWDCPSGTLAPYGEESLAQLGVTTHLGGRTPPRTVAANDLSWVPYTTRLLADKDDKGIMKPTCWNHEPDITQHVENIVKPHEKSRQHGVFVYSLGDEGVTRGACLHPDCLAAFRKYLGTEYKTIEALNRSWGTPYANFDEANLLPSEDSDAREAKRTKNYPRWYDRQAFQCANFATYCKRYVEEFAKLDPQARVGFEGAGSFEQGDDYDLIVRTNGFWSPYPGLGDEIIRSIAPRDFPRSNWMGYTKDADSLLSKYWRMITRGCDSVWWWRWDCIGAFHGFLAPHLGPYTAVKEIVKDTKVVRDGLGTLLTKSRMLDDGIALLYSMPSAYAVQVEQGPAYGGYVQTHEAWSRVVRELGLQYRYVTDRMLRLGDFNHSRFKVILLARAEALGSEEAGVLRDFVQRGGTVIADLRPGLYDGHCKPLAAGVLDDLFGIKRTNGDKPPVTGKARLAYSRAHFELTNATCDPAVKLQDGQAHGKSGNTPLIITNKYGKGLAILLNFSLCTYPALGNAQTPERAADLFKEIFRCVGVQPPVRIFDKQNRRMRNIETIRWRNGDSELIALFREGGESAEAEIKLPKERQVYDLRNHRALGQVKTISSKILAGRATFFALTSRPIEPVKIGLASESISPGMTLPVHVEVLGAATRCAIRLKVALPDGETADWLNRVLIVEPGGATILLPIAYNDPIGKWTLQLTELYTNRSVKMTFGVK